MSRGGAASAPRPGCQLEHLLRAFIYLFVGQLDDRTTMARPLCEDRGSSSERCRNISAAISGNNWTLVFLGETLLRLFLVFRADKCCLGAGCGFMESLSEQLQKATAALCLFAELRVSVDVCSSHLASTGRLY